MKNITSYIVIAVAVIAAGFMLWGGGREAGAPIVQETGTTPPTTDTTIPSGGATTSTDNGTSGTDVSAGFTLADVAAHDNKGDCWLVIDGSVYDVTAFIPTHPGGEAILKGCGKDATEMFQTPSAHEEKNAAALLPTYYKGEISQ